MAVVAIALVLRQRRKLKGMQHIKEQHELFTDASKRKSAVSNATFERKKMMNFGETVAFEELTQILDHSGVHFKICPQVPLVAMINETTANAQRLHKGLYCDFVLMNADREAAVVIEIDGSGHSSERDAIKDEILQKAGIKLIRVDTSDYDKRQNYASFVRKRVNDLVLHNL